MRIKLNSKQYEYFENGGSLIFEIDGDIAIKIRDWVGDSIQRDGFDNKYELNENGAILEQLEDLLYE